MALTSIMTNNENTAIGSLIDGLIRLPGIPQSARNRLWENATLEGWDPGTEGRIPAPTGDSVDVTAEISDGDKAVALGASLGADDLDMVIAAYPRSSLWAGAALNPNLSDATRAYMSTSKLSDGLFDARDEAEAGLAAMTDTEQADDVAKALIAAGCGYTVETLIGAQLAGTSHMHEGDVANAALTQLRERRDGPTLRMRASLLCTPGPVAERIIDGIVASERAVIDQWALPAVIARVDAGTLDIDDIAARLDADCVTWAQLLGGTAASLVSDEELQVRVSKPKHPGLRRQQVDMTDALDLIGLGAAGRRLSLSSSAGLTASDQRSMIAEADVETVMDWAEGSLTHKPGPGEIYDAVATQSSERLEQISAEARRRDGDVPADLLCVLPGMAGTRMKPASVRRSWFLLSETLEGDPVAWDIMVGLLANGWDASIIELAEACSVAALNPA